MAERAPEAARRPSCLRGPRSVDATAERWPSGRRRTPGKCVGGRPSRGFESLPLRHLPREMHPDPSWRDGLPLELEDTARRLRCRAVGDCRAGAETFRADSERRLAAVRQASVPMARLHDWGLKQARQPWRCVGRRSASWAVRTKRGFQTGAIGWTSRSPGRPQIARPRRAFDPALHRRCEVPSRQTETMTNAGRRWRSGPRGRHR